MGTKTKSFTSAMTGAPVLSGTAGALIAVLDAALPSHTVRVPVGLPQTAALGSPFGALTVERA